VLGGDTHVLAARGKSPMVTTRPFGRGRTVYLSGHKYTPANVRLLHRAIFFAARKEPLFEAFSCSNVRTECAYYPKHGKLVVVNNGDKAERTCVTLGRARAWTSASSPTVTRSSRSSVFLARST